MAVGLQTRDLVLGPCPHMRLRAVDTCFLFLFCLCPRAAITCLPAATAVRRDTSRAQLRHVCGSTMATQPPRMWLMVGCALLMALYMRDCSPDAPGAPESPLPQQPAASATDAPNADVGVAPDATPVGSPTLLVKFCTQCNACQATGI